MPCTSSPSPTISPTDMRGLSELNGSWKTICICRRSGRMSRWLSACRSLPSKRMPPSLRSSRSRARPSVVLPEPDFADQPDRVAFAQRDADAVDRLHVADGPAQHAALDREMHLEVVEPQDLRRVGIGGGRPALRLGREQMLRVGMLRPVEHLGHRPLLDDLALGHDADPVGHLAHDAEVVGDEQQRHAVAAPAGSSAASGSAPGW